MVSSELKQLAASVNSYVATMHHEVFLRSKVVQNDFRSR